MLTFFDQIGEMFNGKIPGFLIFLYGLLAGVVFFLLTFLILTLIAKSKKIIDKYAKNEQIEVNPEYKNIIKTNKDNYSTNCKGQDIKIKLNGIWTAISSMMNEISLLYYPNSKDPMFEITIDQLVDFLRYLTKRVNYTVDRILEGKLSIVERFSKNSFKDKRISSLLLMFNGKEKKPEELIKPKKENKLFKWVKKKAINTGIKIGLNMVDDEIIKLIEDLGEDINKLYSKQPLDFLLLSKRDKKLKKEALKVLDKIEDKEEEE